MKGVPISLLRRNIGYDGNIPHCRQSYSMAEQYDSWGPLAEPFFVFPFLFQFPFTHSEQGGSVTDREYCAVWA